MDWKRQLNRKVDALKNVTNKNNEGDNMIEEEVYRHGVWADNVDKETTMDIVVQGSKYGGISIPLKEWNCVGPWIDKLAKVLTRFGYFSKQKGCVVYDRGSPGKFVEVPVTDLEDMIRHVTDPSLEFMGYYVSYLLERLPSVIDSEIEAFERIERNDPDVKPADKYAYKYINFQLGLGLNEQFKWLNDYLPYEL